MNMTLRELLKSLHTEDEKLLNMEVYVSPASGGYDPISHTSVLLHGVSVIHLAEPKPGVAPEDDSIAAVDPVDLRNVWRLFHDFQVRNPGQGGMVDSGACEGVCSPKADVMAVWHRASLLGMMESPFTRLTPWTHNGELDDVVFKVAATFPIKKTMSYNKDLKELLKQIEQAAKG